MRTIVYVDGFNFYHGLVKRSGYKWLDLYKLFEEQLLPIRARESQLIQVKFFTAEIKAKFASRGELAHQAQQAYHRALVQIYGDKLQIIKGYYSERQECAMTFNEGHPPSKTDRTTVWKLEEKQTDVRMALEMYRDAIRGEVEQLVLCTNDSDMIPPI
ncbi:NYN domain-containing protein, partial [Klebsiella pneumoniae]